MSWKRKRNEGWQTILKNSLRKPEVVCRMIKQWQESACDSVKHHCPYRNDQVLLCIAALSCYLWEQRGRCWPWCLQVHFLDRDSLCLRTHAWVIGTQQSKQRLAGFRGPCPWSLIGSSWLAQANRAVTCVDVWRVGQRACGSWWGLWKIEVRSDHSECQICLLEILRHI